MSAGNRTVIHALEMPRGQMLSLSIHWESRTFTLAEDMPPLIPSQRISEPTVEMERIARQLEWSAVNAQRFA